MHWSAANTSSTSIGGCAHYSRVDSSQSPNLSPAVPVPVPTTTSSIALPNAMIPPVNACTPLNSLPDNSLSAYPPPPLSASLPPLVSPPPAVSLSTNSVPFHSPPFLFPPSTLSVPSQSVVSILISSVPSLPTNPASFNSSLTSAVSPSSIISQIPTVSLPTKSFPTCSSSVVFPPSVASLPSVSPLPDDHSSYQTASLPDATPPESSSLSDVAINRTQNGENCKYLLSYL